MVWYNIIFYTFANHDSNGSGNPISVQPLHKPNQLIYGTGQTAVISGWTVKQAIAKQLQPTGTVIGQLYSATRGINLLIRNLLANPHVLGCPQRHERRPERGWV